MHNFTIRILTASALLTLVPLPLHAEEQTQTQQQTQTQEQTTERVYGWQLMTEQERQQFREEHHKAMQERAKERGVTLPDEPMGPGPGGGGMGGGMGGRNR